jgi:uncharacterized protein YjbJ (UPF0337 family)
MTQVPVPRRLPGTAAAGIKWHPRRRWRFGHHIHKEGIAAMNKHQVKGAAREAAGKAQKNLGKAAGSTRHQVKGTARELAGKTQKEFGNIRRDAEHRRDEQRRTHR